MLFEPNLSAAEIARRLPQRERTRRHYWRRRYGTLPPLERNPDPILNAERPVREYPAYVQAAWWAQPTTEGRREAIIAKIDREQPEPTYCKP